MSCSLSQESILSDNQKHSPERKNIKGNVENGWNFIQALTNTCYNFNSDQLHVYVHPLDKRSSCSISLEMCTESLGSETGNHIDHEFSYLDMETQICSRIHNPKASKFSNKIKHSTSFPPPLTTISGRGGVEMRSHREGGRLVIKAIVSSCTTYFKAERENGSLRLCLIREDYWDIEHEYNVVENEEQVQVQNRHKEVGCKIGGEWPSLPFCVAIS